VHVHHTTQSNINHHDSNNDFTGRQIPSNTPTHSSNNNNNNINSNIGGSGSNHDYAPTTDSSDGSSSTSNTNAGTSSTRVGEMSIRRALLLYFIPIYLKWIGDIFSPLL
jgi:hypothetical protein